MKFPWSWICEHIKLTQTAEEAGELISMRGLTVDAVEADGDDWILDIDILANRPDAMCVRGIARELSAITGVGLEPLKLNFHELTKRAGEYAGITIEAQDLCHRFTGRVIRNIKNRETPEWMRRRLEQVGMRSLDLLVDITNYVLWELGHPVHGYDLNLLPGGRIIVRRATAGEKVALLDGTTRALDPSMLVIADNERAIGLGGIMGGADTEINDRTTDIFLECAWFDAVNVRRTARTLGIKTEASYRFERGMDIDDIPMVSERCCHLFQTLAGGEICKEMIDEYPTEHDPVSITMSHDRLTAFAGMEISREKVGKIFTLLDFSATFRETFWRVSVPSRRVDITREADLFEEVIRLVGYEAIPPTLPKVDQPVREPNLLHMLIDRADSALLGAGFAETINYDFIDPDGNALFAPPEAGTPFVLTNPIAAPQMSVMRQSLAPSLMQVIRHNHYHGSNGLRIFEIARVFHAVNGAPVEKTCVAVAMDGGPGDAGWRNRVSSADFYDIKGVMEFLFTRLGLFGIIVDKGTMGFLDPGASALIRRVAGGEGEDGSASAGNPVVGWLGRVARPIQQQYDLPFPVYLGQFELEAVLGNIAPARRFSRESRYPSISRDISLVAPDGGAGEKLAYRTIVNAITRSGVAEIADVRLLDIYRGKETAGGASMTIRIKYQSYDRTLTQEEVESRHATVKDSLAALGITFR